MRHVIGYAAIAATIFASTVRAEDFGPSIRVARRPARSEALATDAPPTADAAGSKTVSPAKTASPAAATPAAPATSSRQQASATPAAAPAADRGVRVSHTTPSLAVSMTGPKRASVGKEAAYVLKLENSGPSAVSELVVSIAAGQGAEITQARASNGSTAITEGAAGCLWKFDKVDPFGEHELNLVITPRKSVPVALDVSWTHPQPALHASLEVDEPKLIVELAGPSELLYGQHQAYHLSVKNPGTGDAEQVVVRLPSAEDAVASTYQIGTLKAGANTTLELEVAANHAGKLSIEAEVSGASGLQAAATKDVWVRRPGLDIALSTLRAQYTGAVVPCEVRVRNPGDAPAHNVHISMLLPEGAEFLTASHDGGPTTKKHEIVWRLGELAAGAEQVLTARCKLSKPGDTMIDALASATGDLTSETSTAVQVIPVAAMQLEVAGASGPVPVGTPTEYVITIRNRGTTIADDLELLGIFSDGLTPVGAEDGSAEMSEHSIRLKPSAVAVGGEAHYVVTARAAESGNHQLRVELRSKTLGVKLAQELSAFFYAEQAATGTATR